MSDRALYNEAVKLAHNNPGPIRDALLPVLKEAKGQVPEAFKAQWKKKDKDDDGKINEDKPDFLKDKEEKEDKKKASLRSSTIRLAHSLEQGDPLKSALLDALKGS